ncbi:MAG: hypothetical protein KDD42_06310 [Bdellovibrionales bacterium]|nr:hypothetical protein [Bdellovibrionales bacterium]
MQNVRWLTFGMASALTRTILHFYPSSGNVSAPYPVSCRLTIFAQGEVGNSITVEGLRLSQPEGIWVDEAFPVLRDNSVGFYGLEILLSCAQQRVDLDPSMCVIELLSAVQSTRFWPHRLDQATPEMAKQEANLMPLFGDAFNTTSLVVLNYSNEAKQPSLSVNNKNGESVPLPGVPQQTIAARSVLELDFSKFPEALAVEQPTECGWGLLRGRGLRLEPSVNQELAYFAVYRDVLTKRPVSVCAL